MVVFLGIAVALTLALAWLSWRVLQQDKAVERQRVQDDLERAATAVISVLSAAVSQVEAELDRLGARTQRDGLDMHAARTLVPDGGLIVSFSPKAVAAVPRDRLLYFPPILQPPSPTDSFAEAERVEFHQQKHETAAAIYSKLADARDVGVRAGALLRQARVLRKANSPVAALAAYERLAALGPVPLEGSPADLVARHARCTMLEALGRRGELEREADALYAELYSGRWPLARGAFLFYDGSLATWVNPARVTKERSRVREEQLDSMAAAVAVLWDEWQRRERTDPAPARRLLWSGADPLAVVARPGPDRLMAFVGGSRWLKRHLGRAAHAAGSRVRVALADLDGRPVSGSTPAGSPLRVVRGTPELPWVVHLAGVMPDGEAGAQSMRRRLVIGSVLLVAALGLGAVYFITRSVARELEVARLQKHFVSAVSHEFRTPLASMLQLSELLVDGRVPSEERRHDYYQRLYRETERLHRLVENLLDFGRMQAGAREYRFEQVDPAVLVGFVGQEFAQKVESRGYRIEMTLRRELPRICADRQAIGLSLWNLLDNAVKYSPACKTVWLEATAEDSHVAIHVRDRGLGIAPAEQKQIFKEFVRAASAEAAGVKGTGLGLAMVHRVIAAHGGEVRVKSVPGAGSTFTMRLPIMKV